VRLAVLVNVLFLVVESPDEVLAAGLGFRV
jgi:hypothetical protein